MFTPDFSGVHVPQSLIFCVVFCGSLFVLLSFFFRRVTDYDYPFGIFSCDSIHLNILVAI